MVLDVLGRKVYSENGSTSRLVNLNHLENGIYTVKVSGEGKILSQRVVINK